MITNYKGTNRYYIIWRERAQVADELAEIVVHEQPQATTIDELTDWLDERADIVDPNTGDLENASWFSADLQQRLGVVDDLRCKLDRDGRAVYHVRFTDERNSTTRRRESKLYTEMTLVYHDSTWEGDPGNIDQSILDDARMQITAGISHGGVWPFDLVYFDVR